MFDFGSSQLDHSEFSKEKIGISDTLNTLNGYTIESTRLLPELSNEYVDAFPASNSDSPNEEFYALAFKKHYPLPIREVRALSAYTGSVLLAPKTYGIVTLNNNAESKNFCIILKKPKGKSLAALLAKGIRFDEAFIFSKILRPILSALNFLHQNNIAHGCINLNTIYIDESGHLYITECLSTPTGINQNPFFETIERTQANLYAKGPGSPIDDYYSLGIVLFSMIGFGKLPNIEPKEIISRKLAKGTHDYLMNITYISGKLGELIKGLTQDNPDNRYGYINVDAILENKNHAIKSVADGNMISRAIIFNSKEFYSKRALADEFVNNWDLAKEFIKTDKIIKWLAAISSEEQYVEMLQNFSGGMVSSRIPGARTIPPDDERLMRLLILLDPMGPIRLKSIAFIPEGLGQFMCHLIVENQSDIMTVVLSVLLANVFSAYEFRATYLQDFNKISHIISISHFLENLRKADAASGIERLTYDLNPSLCCQHAELKNDVIISLHDLLATLEDDHLNMEEVLKKKATIAFVASRVKIMPELNNPALTHVPSFSKNLIIQSLLAFAAAQKLTRIPKLEKLSRYFYEQIMDLGESIFKSKTSKKQLETKLNTSLDAGSLEGMVSTLKTTDLFLKDHDGFNKALRRGAEITCEIFGYNNRNMLYHDIRRKGLGFAVKASYIASAFAVVMLLLKSF